MLCVVIVPFLVLAFVVLYPLPSRTGHLFAWHIHPDLTGMVLAAAYLGGAYFFTRAAAARAWHLIKAGFAPVCLFATLMGVATIVHWDTFNHASVAFWLWSVLYFTTPFLVLATWLRNRRHDRVPEPGDLLLEPTATWLIAAVAIVALATGVFLFTAPAAAIAVWPWTLTPLTARVLGAVFCLGLAGVAAPLDRRWTTARLPLQVAGVMLVLIIVAGVREHRALDPTNPLTWLLAAGFVALLAAGSSFYFRMTRASTSGHGPAAPRGGS